MDNLVDVFLVEEREGERERELVNRGEGEFIDCYGRNYCPSRV